MRPTVALLVLSVAAFVLAVAAVIGITVWVAW